MSNCFLIREPRRVLLSFAKVIPNPRLDQTGFPQQVEIFNHVREATGKIPPVIKARDVLLNPEVALSRLCAALDVPYDPAMLRWRAGKRGERWYPGRSIGMPGLSSPRVLRHIRKMTRPCRNHCRVC